MSQSDEVTEHNGDMASSPSIPTVLADLPRLFLKKLTYTVTPVHNRDLLCKGANIAKQTTTTNQLIR